MIKKIFRKAPLFMAAGMAFALALAGCGGTGSPASNGGGGGGGSGGIERDLRLVGRWVRGSLDLSLHPDGRAILFVEGEYFSSATWSTVGNDTLVFSAPLGGFTSDPYTVVSNGAFLNHGGGTWSWHTDQILKDAPADFGNLFDGEWVRTVPDGDVTLTITATSASAGTWALSGQGAPLVGADVIFEKRVGDPLVAYISGAVRVPRWELSSDAQTLTWPDTGEGADWVFVRATP